jgi:lysophospholipase L1-like esterase
MDGASPGSKVHIGTAPDTSPVGKSASIFDVYYLKGPKRGTFDVVVDGEVKASIDSDAPAFAPGIFRLEVPDGPHGFDVVVSLPPDKKPRYVRMLGSDLERTKPGVIVDQLGVGAMGTRCITLEKPEIAEPLIAYRRYDLIILMTGTADIYQLDQSVDFVKYVVDLHRKANPNVSFLAVSPPDRGESLSLPALLTLGEQRKALSSDIGIGYWDLLAGMGGPRSMLNFRDKAMGLPDQIHFSEAGGAWVGHRLERAILASFEQYLEAHPRAGCDGLDIDEPEPQSAGLH